MSRHRKKGESPNSQCDFCRVPIWVRTGVYTQYHGKGYYWNDSSKKEPCSYTYLETDEHTGAIKSGSCCPKCFKELGGNR
jgi:hypothetical protein